MSRRMRYADTDRFDVVGPDTDTIVVDTREHPRQVTEFHELVQHLDRNGHQRTGMSMAYAEFCARQHGDAGEYQRWKHWQRGRGGRAMPFPATVRSAQGGSSEGVTVSEVLPENAE